MELITMRYARPHALWYTSRRRFAQPSQKRVPERVENEFFVGVLHLIARLRVQMGERRPQLDAEDFLPGDMTASR